MLQGIPRSAICVQNFDDSLSFAIRITYRISLRSSSLREPRYPLLKVVQLLIIFQSVIDFSQIKIEMSRCLKSSPKHTKSM